MLLRPLFAGGGTEVLEHTVVEARSAKVTLKPATAMPPEEDKEESIGGGFVSACLRAKTFPPRFLLAPSQRLLP
jgi:hypothetical protein